MRSLSCCKRRSSEVDSATAHSVSTAVELHDSDSPGHRDKRRRRQDSVLPSSFDSASTSTPFALTETNLRFFTYLSSSSTATASNNMQQATPARSRSPTKTVANEHAKLKAYKIRDITHVLAKARMPTELQALIAAFGTEPRQGPASARARRIAERHRAAAKKNEDTTIDITARDLYLQPWLWDGEHEQIDVARNHNLNRGFLRRLRTVSQKTWASWRTRAQIYALATCCPPSPRIFPKTRQPSSLRGRNCSQSPGDCTLQITLHFPSSRCR